MSGFKYYKPTTASIPSAYSTTDAIGTATSTVHSYTVLDSSMMLVVSASTAAAVASVWF